MAAGAAAGCFYKRREISDHLSRGHNGGYSDGAYVEMGEGLGGPETPMFDDQTGAPLNQAARRLVAPTPTSNANNPNSNSFVSESGGAYID
jgi:hypothetical protein